MNERATEIASGDRFSFGANWTRFLAEINDERIASATQSLCEMLCTTALTEKRFLDIGSGSGLSSLAARRLGAIVHSFDYDPQSVACTAELKRRYFPGDSGWTIEQGSVLDAQYLKTLGQWDIVYSWGVLHHTGQMWQALDNVASLAQVGGSLFVAIYNDQGGASRRWRYLKQLYNKHSMLRVPLALYTVHRQWTLTFIRDALRGQPLMSWRGYKSARGMSAWRDVVDWIGGYPFEVAKPEEIFDLFKQKGFRLERLKTLKGGNGCNEFVFTRVLQS